MRTVGSDRLESACKLLGDTVLDPAVWPQVMDQICRAVGATGAGLLQSDVRTPDVPRTASVDEALSHYFRTGWHLRDIRATRGVPLLLDGAPVVVDQDLMTIEEMRRDPCYNETVFGFGLQWFAMVRFQAGSAIWVLSIQRTPQEGPFERQDKRLLATLSQRLTEVASLSTAVGRTVLSSATNALNLVRQPAVAIDRFGFVLDANEAASAIFDDEFYIKNRRVFILAEQERRAFQLVLDRLRKVSDTDSLSVDPIIVRRKRRASVIIRVLPVHGAARSPFLGARALLTFTPIEPRPTQDTRLLLQAFSLTPAEAKLASLMASGMSLESAAEKLKIARHTARTQLKAIFIKTGTHRQSQLVALLSRL